MENSVATPVETGASRPSQTGTSSEASQPGQGAAPPGSPSPAASQPREGAARPDPASPSSRFEEWELAIWRDPKFRKRFIESYMAETEIEPRVTVSERDQMEEVLELISSEQMEKAVKLLEKHRGDTASAVFDFTLANIHFQRDQFDRAINDYQIAVDKYPKFRRAWRNLGLIYVRQEDFPNAVRALTRVVELGGGDAITFGVLGFAYSNMGNDLSAESAYRMATLLDPDTTDWKRGLSYSLFKQQRYADAVAFCGTMIAEQPDRADLWLLQANAYIGLNQALRAAENYELVDRLGKSTVDSLNMLGDIYINEELFEAAVNSYIRAMEKDPQGNGERAIRAAKVLTSRGAFVETLRLIERVETLYGDQLEGESRKDLLRLRARLAVAEGSGEEEARVLQEIVSLDPLDGEALILLGQHYGRSGETEKAVFYYERAASLEPFEADAKVRHAQLLVNEGKYAEALPLLRRAQMLKPRDHVQEYMEQVERVAQNR